MSLDSKTSGRFTSGSESSHFSMLLLVRHDPVDGGVISDGVVEGVDTNDFVIFVSSILGYPIRIEYSKVTHDTAYSFFSERSEIPFGLEFIDSGIDGLAVDTTFGYWVLSSSSSDSGSVDHITLFGLVTKSSGFVRSG
jgi:hypothetical protein